MKLLSLTYGSHDSSICYFDGEKLNYFKSERITQEKHHDLKSLDECEQLIKKVWNISFDDVDEICIPIFYRGVPFISRPTSNPKITEIDHHYAHTLSVELFDGRPDVSIIVDGQGGTNCWAVYKDNTLVECGDVDKHGSIGHGMQFFGVLLEIPGRGLDAPGKVMGLQSYGDVDLDYLKKLQEYDIYSIGAKSIKIPGQRGALYIGGDQLFSMKDWTGTKLDWVKTVHYRCGEILLDFFKQHAKPDDVIHYSGGVAQNVIWNTLLKKHFKNLVVLPHCGDEGLSLGGIEFLRRKHNLTRFNVDNFPFMQSDELPSEPSDDTIQRTAKLLADGKIVAWYQGHGEVGPRALGNRSMLMDPRISNGKDIMNSVKGREYYRPFGASVLSEHAKEYFDLDFENPYMLYVGVTQKDNLESITHIDGTCRVQTVTTGHFRKLLEYFYELTGCPVLMNTSLNISGKPIVGHISDAKKEFETKNIDALVVGDEIYIK
jgi:carbamoyltransferase